MTLIPSSVAQTRTKSYPGFTLRWPWTGDPPRLSIEYWTPELDLFLQHTDIRHFAVSMMYEDRGPGLRILEPIADQIEGFACGKVGSEVLPTLVNLQELSLFEPVSNVDLGAHPRLRTLSAESHLVGISACASLEDVTLTNLKGTDLGVFSALTKLRRLFLKDCRQLVSLDGIQDLPLEELRFLMPTRLASVGAVANLSHLTHFQLNGAKRVTDLARLGEAQTLRVVMLESAGELGSFDFVAGLTELEEFHICDARVTASSLSLFPFRNLANLRVLKLGSGLRKAIDVEVIGSIPSLEVLWIEGAPELPSLEFLRGLSSLERLDILGTPIRDGNLRVLLELPNLKRLYYLDPQKKHYSHTGAEIAAALEARHPMPLPSEVAAAQIMGRRALSKLFESAAKRIEANAEGVERAATQATPARVADAAERPGSAGPSTSSVAGPVNKDVLLGNVDWRFDETVSSVDELVQRIAEEGEATWDPGEVVIAATRIRLHVPELGPEGSPLELTTAEPGFTAAELLFNIHEALSPELGASDYRYFEGLSREGAEADAVPRYTVHLGS